MKDNDDWLKWSDMSEEGKAIVIIFAFVLFLIVMSFVQG